MFWIKEYCKHFKLTLEGTRVFLDNDVVATIDYYENIIHFEKTKTRCKLSDIAHAIIENVELH